MQVFRSVNFVTVPWHAKSATSGACVAEPLLRALHTSVLSCLLHLVSANSCIFWPECARPATSQCIALRRVAVKTGLEYMLACALPVPFDTVHATSYTLCVVASATQLTVDFWLVEIVSKAANLVPFHR